MILIGAGDENPRALQWGHWAPARWLVPTEGHRSEVLIAGESLSRPARDTLGTLVHEAAHGLAWARKIQDTSRQSRYHNKAYKALAEEVGLTVNNDRLHGWTITTITPETCAHYSDVLALLEAAVEANRKAHRRWARGGGDDGGEDEGGDKGGQGGEGDGDGEGGKRAPTLHVCACERQIRVSGAEYLRGYIMCGLCGKPFLTPGDPQPLRHDQPPRRRGGGVPAVARKRARAGDVARGAPREFLGWSSLGPSTTLLQRMATTASRGTVRGGWSVHSGAASLPRVSSHLHVASVLIPCLL